MLVLACGCFDPLHPGHVAHLKEARSLGDQMIVALTTDNCFNKGPHRPFLTWAERESMLSELRCVDWVVPSRHAADSIIEVRPNIFVKGEDWKDRLPEKTIAACRHVGCNIVFTTTPRFGTEEMIRRLMRGR